MLRARTVIVPLLALVLGVACGSRRPPLRRTSEVPVNPQRMRDPEPMVDPSFIEAYAATMRFRLGHPAEVTVVPGGETVLFLRSGPRSFVRNLFAFDVETGTESVLLTAEQLLGGQEAELSEEEKARRERLRLAARGITSFELSQDGTRILVPLSGRLFIFDRESRKVTELPDDGGYANDAHLSRDGKKVACVREGDLYVIDVESKKQRRLTDTASEHVTNGLPEFVAQEEMRRYHGWWWSPDGERLVYQRTDTSEVEVLYAADPIHPASPPAASPYPRAGKTNASVRLGVISVGGGKTRWIEWDRDAYPYLATVRWTEDAPLTLVVQNRHQTREQVLAADPRSGRTETLFEEADEAWLNLDQQMPKWIGGGEQMLWTTERNGGWQLELRDRKGKRVRALTEVDLGYERLLHVDEERGVVWVAASAEPTETHIKRLPLDGEGTVTQVSEAPGVHGAVFGDSGDTWVQWSHTLEHGPRATVRRGEDSVGPLESKAEAPPIEPQVELVTVGELDYRAAVVRPRNFDEAVRYPVIVSVYGGPGHRVVRATRNGFLHEQWLADHGFVVVSLDGRGTPGRGRDWERAIAGNFIKVPLSDQVAGLEALGRRFPELDLSRVGVYGWSFGGYFSAMAVMQRPDIYQVGVAGAPVADWHDYDTHYTERYIGLPQENEAGYEDSNVLTHAPKLERPLLIIHGTSDDNVYFTHAIKMSDALLHAGKPHDFLPLSGFTHMVADPNMAKALHSRIAGFLASGLRAR